MRPTLIDDWIKMSFGDTLDKVIDNNTGKLLFRGTTEETKEFLNHLYPGLYHLVHVVSGDSLERMLVEEYLILYNRKNYTANSETPRKDQDEEA